MRVVMTVQITGTRDGVEWPAPGASLDVSAAEADDLIRAGLATPGRPEPAAVETATLPAAERAISPRQRRKEG